MKTTISLIALAGIAAAANAQIGRAVDANGSNTFLTETITVAPGYDGQGMLSTWGPGDMFGITSRATATGTGLPFAIADDSAVSFPGDSQGIITESDTGFFFGIVDSVNGANSDPAGTGTAVWTFDITGATGLSVTADFAAMGDFEAGQDFFDFTWSIDGSAPAPLFTGSIDEAGSQSYTLAGGGIFSVDDPALINGTVLNNTFQTIAANISGTGSVLTIAFTGGGDGGTEAFAFRNLTVVPAPASVALLGLGGLVATRRRR